MTVSQSSPAVWGPPLGHAVIRQRPEDFQVTELLQPTAVTAAEGGTAEGQSEHLWLWIEKTGDNTAWVAQQLTAHFNVRARDVSWAGRKDRHAVTRQWFSVWLPGAQKSGQWSLPVAHTFQVLDHCWCTRKIRRGAHEGNRFVIRLADWRPADTAALAGRLEQIARHGVPNYYGPQRFGYGFDPRPGPVSWAEDRQLRGMQISALRSHLFNRQLAERVVQGTWNHCTPGQWVCWRGSNAGFLLTELDDRLAAKVANGELSPSAWLAGEVRDPKLAPSADETACLVPYHQWLAQLSARRVQAGRRATVLHPRACELTFRDADPVLTLELPPGAFVTTVLQAVCTITDAARARAESAGAEPVEAD